MYRLLILSLLLISGCVHIDSHRSDIIRINGSDTMLMLTTAWAEEFMKTHEHISIYTEGGGSSTGFHALIDGNAHICASSRPITAVEVRKMAEKHNSLGIAHRVAKDALSVFVNEANPVQSYSLDQLNDIFSGKVKNWSELGWIPAKIDVLIRNPNSGTYLYFKEHVLKDKNYASESISKSTNNAVVQEIARNRYAIGYGGSTFGEFVIHAKINNISPSYNNIRNDIYPVSRYLYLYTIDNPEGVVKDFIDWVFSLQGQTIVAKTGFIPLWENN